MTELEQTEQAGQIHISRRDFMKASTLGAAASYLTYSQVKLGKFLNVLPNIDGTETKKIPVTPLQLWGSTYPNNSNLLMLFTEINKQGYLSIGITPETPTTSIDGGSVSANLVLINPETKMGDVIVDATPLYDAPVPDRNNDKADKGGRYISKRLTAEVLTIPESRVQENSANGEYLNELDEAKEEMLKKFGTEVLVGGSVYIDFINDAKDQPEGIKVQIISPDGEKLMVRWISAIDTDLTPANLQVEADNTGNTPRRGRVKVGINKSQQSPFPTETSIPFDKMTDEQKLASAPTVDGLTNEFYRNNQIIRRDIEGKVVEIYKADTKETIQIPEGYTFFDIKQFPDSDSFLEYSGEKCASSFVPLGGDGEALLLEKALNLPERFMWTQDVIGHAISTTGYDNKCSRIFHSNKSDFSAMGSFGAWGEWKGNVRIAYLTSLTGDADVFIYYP